MTLRLEERILMKIYPFWFGMYVLWRNVTKESLFYSDIEINEDQPTARLGFEQNYCLMREQKRKKKKCEPQSL